MSVVARRIRATPVRTASEVWTTLTQLVCQDDPAAVKDFGIVAGLAAALIASESFREQPFVVIGSGPRLRVYCLYDEAAIVGDDSNEDPLRWKPTSGEWEGFLPCNRDDLDWVSKRLKEKSVRFRAYDVAEGIEEETAEGRSAGLQIDAERFKRA